MRFKTFNLISTSSVILLVPVIVFLLFYLSVLQKDIIGLYDDKYRLVEQAVRLSNATKYLTNEVRTYIQYGDQLHLDLYNAEINTHDNRGSSIEEMKIIGILDSEFELIEKMKVDADKLEAFDKQAINFYESGNYEAAKNALYGSEYIAIRSDIDEKLDVFTKQISDRVSQGIVKIENVKAILGVVFTILIIALIVIFICIFIFTSKKIINPIKRLSAAMQKMAKGDFEEKLSIKVDNSEIGILVKAYYDAVMSVHCLVEEFEYIKQGIVYGKLTQRSNAAKFMGRYKDVVLGVNSIIDTLTGYMDNLSLPIILIGKDFSLNYMNKAALSLSGKTQDEILGTKCYDYFNTSHCKTEHCAVKKCMESGQITKAEVDAHPFGKDLVIEYVGIPTRDDEGNIVGALEYVIDFTELDKAKKMETERSKYQEGEIDKLTVELSKLSEGKLNISYVPATPSEGTKDVYISFSKISQSLDTSTKFIKSYIDEMSKILEKFSQKDITGKITREYLGDFVALKTSINTIQKSLNDVLGEILSSTNQVEVSASQAASASQNLAHGATEQAGSIEEISATASQISTQAKANSENAEKAKQLSFNAKVDAENGNEQIIEMVSAMDAIKDASKDIAKIIKVIQDIAFQTNLLALNAAVEAARAGVHGKGFAVVAEEVRNLASRSSKAAKETTALIDNSLSKIEDGVTIAASTKEALSKIVNSVMDTVSLVETIADASEKQTSAIYQMEQGIEQISRVTLSNTATAEESASTSQEIAAQTQLLEGLISEFKLSDNN